MIIGDTRSFLDLVVDFLVVAVTVDLMLLLAVRFVVEFLGYRWGQIVNRHDVRYVVLDFYEICILAKVSLNLKRPEIGNRRKEMKTQRNELFNTAHSKLTQ